MNSTLDNLQAATDKNYVSWKLQFDAIFNFEIPTGLIRQYLPRQLYPVELRPGISILSIGVPYFLKGNLNCLPIFKELSLSVIVQPNLRLIEQVPRFAFYVLNVLSDNEDFLKYANEVDKMPIYESKGLNFSIDTKNFSISIGDRAGLILDLRSSYVETYTFQKKHEILQLFSSHQETIYYNKVEWSAYALEHQTTGEVGKLFNHPFFLGIDVNSLKSSDCCLQVITNPAEMVLMNFYQPKKLNDAHSVLISGKTDKNACENLRGINR